MPTSHDLSIYLRAKQNGKRSWLVSECGDFDGLVDPRLEKGSLGKSKTVKLAHIATWCSFTDLFQARQNGVCFSVCQGSAWAPSLRMSSNFTLEQHEAPRIFPESLQTFAKAFQKAGNTQFVDQSEAVQQRGQQLQPQEDGHSDSLTQPAPQHEQQLQAQEDEHLLALTKMSQQHEQHLQMQQERHAAVLDEAVKQHAPEAACGSRAAATPGP